MRLKRAAIEMERHYRQWGLQEKGTSKNTWEQKQENHQSKQRVGKANEMG